MYAVGVRAVLWGAYSYGVELDVIGGEDDYVEELAVDRRDAPDQGVVDEIER